MEQEKCEHGVVKKYCFRCIRPDLAGKPKTICIKDTDLEMMCTCYNCLNKGFK